MPMKHLLSVEVAINPPQAKSFLLLLELGQGFIPEDGPTEHDDPHTR